MHSNLDKSPADVNPDTGLDSFSTAFRAGWKDNLDPNHFDLEEFNDGSGLQVWAFKKFLENLY